MVRDRLLAAVAVWLVAAAAYAQAPVSGRVTDSLGAALPGVTATLRALPPAGAAAMPDMPNMPNMPAPTELTATGDANGAFTFNSVPAG